MTQTLRNAQLDALDQQVFDVLIVGGGINGACLYYHLCERGYSVLLVDKGDFASGTSQASAMMIWGGLLYLRNWDLLTVRRLCSSRDRMLREMDDWIKPRQYRYVPLKRGGRSKALVHAALYFYWLLGGCQRLRPRRENHYSEKSFLDPQAVDGSLVYEEGIIEPSDARFVLHWLLSHQNSEQVALNYTGLHGGAYHATTRRWELELVDALGGAEHRVRTKWVINTAGVWTDMINQEFRIESEFRHVLSKGAWIGLKRFPGHRDPLLFDTLSDKDNMSFIPWGPISLWGPTESAVSNPNEGFAVQPDDIQYLLGELNRHLSKPVGPEDIVSLRCGARPLVVKQPHTHSGHLLDLSRRHAVCCDRHRPWISVYGGKLTNCTRLALEVTNLLSDLDPPNSGAAGRAKRQVAVPELDEFPSLSQRIPSARWCVQNEMCWTLEDYLRRRTNVAQWVARGGLGMNDEHLTHLTELAGVFSRNGDGSADLEIADYRRKIVLSFDRVLSKC